MIDRRATAVQTINSNSNINFNLNSSQTKKMKSYISFRIKINLIKLIKICRGLSKGIEF